MRGCGVICFRGRIKISRTYDACAYRESGGLNDFAKPTLYMQRVRNFVRAERILCVTGIIVLVTSLHVSQSQGIVLPDVGSGKLVPMKRTSHRCNALTLTNFVCTYFCCNFMSARRHSTVGRGSPTTRQAILTSTRHGTTMGTPYDIIAAGTN